MANEVKTVSSDKAFELFVKHYPLKLTVADRFFNQHSLFTVSPNLSSRESKKAALGRYRDNPRIATSTWVLLDTRSLIDKAQPAPKVACIHVNNQQLAVSIKATSRTVTIQEVTPKEKSQNKYRDVQTVQVGRNTTYVTCESKDTDGRINIVGDWDPLTGDFELYHYEARALPAQHNMLARYLKWRFDKTLNAYIGPEAH